MEDSREAEYAFGPLQYKTEVAPSACSSTKQGHTHAKPQDSYKTQAPRTAVTP